MAIIVNFAGASLRKPGAYSRTKIASSGAAEAQLGVVALIGEADEGPAFNASDVEASAYGPDQFSDIQNQFGSGELVDMAKLALAPSVDPQIAGGAQKLYLLKTNVGSKATLALPTSYGSLSAKLAGKNGNKISAQVQVTGSTVVITVARSDLGVSEISEPLGNKVVMTLQCTDGVASVATVTIAGGVLTTSVTGGSASPLNIKLSDFATIGQVVEYINSIPLYSAAVGSAPGAVNMPTSVLDSKTAVDILAVASCKRDLQDVKDFFASSGLVDFSPTATAGLPTTLVKSFLTGGAKGSTTASQVTAAIDALAKVRVNFIVPLFSQDATADIASGHTEAGSTYTIAGAIAALKSHCAQMSTVRGRKERQGFAGIKASYDDAKQASSDNAFNRLQLVFQEVQVLASDGSTPFKQPHALAVISAAMKAAAVVGLPNTFKAPNILAFKAPSGDFDPETQADDAIDANLCFVERAPGGGFRFVLDNSTYAQTKDAWFNARPSVIYAADTAALSIRLNTETLVGLRNSDVSVESIKNLLIGVMDSLRASGIIVPDASSGGRGFKDLSVRIEGSIVRISVTLILVEGLEFVLSDITVQRASS
jgi:hypothetical protein